MKTISQVFKTLKKQNRRALIPYITAGDPDLDITAKLILTISQNGGDILELGVPFSDPLADGPTIQAASQRALKSGTTLKGILEMVREIRKKIDIPLVLMSYYNPLRQYGLEALARDASKAGINGFIVPDLTPEEATDWLKVCKEHSLDTIFLIAPTTSLNRARKIAQMSRGFIYYVSVTGVTGARESLPQDIIENLKQLRKITNKPIAVGFGISSPNHVRMLVPYTDGIVVGSAIVKLIGETKELSQICAKVAKFIKNLSQATFIS
ncbi:MAG: Tryptophan synthase alpha chain [Candidatus Methanoperedenaceae archaeon GB37]|nr:Tryptophan synthase alpha chain [Candidatus Methanoperedenaceae archaeon GB37]CAD7783781.1 MAG: Tryptophan synthase alpha chain [Candidatus Methanoperedenaceae archaeon GB37]